MERAEKIVSGELLTDQLSEEHFALSLEECVSTYIREINSLKGKYDIDTNWRIWRNDTDKIISGFDGEEVIEYVKEMIPVFSKYRAEDSTHSLGLLVNTKLHYGDDATVDIDKIPVNDDTDNPDAYEYQIHYPLPIFAQGQDFTLFRKEPLDFWAKYSDSALGRFGTHEPKTFPSEKVKKRRLAAGDTDYIQRYYIFYRKGNMDRFSNLIAEFENSAFDYDYQFPEDVLLSHRIG